MESAPLAESAADFTVSRPEKGPSEVHGPNKGRSSEEIFLGELGLGHALTVDNLRIPHCRKPFHDRARHFRGPSHGHEQLPYLDRHTETRRTSTGPGALL